MFTNKRVLVTGACGTVGSELVHQLLSQSDAPDELLALDNNESEIFFLQEQYRKHENLNCFLGDVRDRDKLSRRMRGIDIVFHAAAYKHVILCEKSPFEAVQTNILGVQNIIYAALESKVGTVIFTSSDKAVNPTNVMGTSKLMGEKLMSAANCNQKEHRTIFSSTRFGNVLGSRGSVIPIFKKQIQAGGPLTLTNPEMSRFIMSVNDAVRLIIDSSALAKGGEVFVTKMPAIRIADLAQVMIDTLAPAYGFSPESIAIETIGAKPGEKLYEELLLNEELRRTLELERYFVVLPAFRELYASVDYTYGETCSNQVDKPYISSSEPFMSQQELSAYLTKQQLLNP